MYGPAETDPVVKYYDISFAKGSAEETAWYLKKAQRFGGPILDLGCGTGRISLLLARNGFEVTGLDQSSGMLDQFRRKIRAERREVQQRIQVDLQSMSDFSLARRFGTVICCDAFFHNLTVEEEIGCLTCVRRHLHPEGRLMFNLPNPTCEFITRAERSKGTEWTERGRFPLPDGEGTLIVEHAQDGDMLHQTITTAMRLTRIDAEGAIIEENYSSWASRYLYRYEAIHLLARCGFEIESLVGDYTDGPLTTKGQLIFQVKPAG